MFLYFDKNGDLKEIINGYPLRQGASGINKLYVYFEDFEESMTPWVRYELPDGTHTIDTVVEDIENNIEIPYDEKRDLKFFKYYTPYTFIVITVPDDVLGFETDEDYLLQATVSLATQDDEDETLETDGSDGEIIPLGLILLNVTHTADNVGYVDNENYISIAQFNYLKKLISDNNVNNLKIKYINRTTTVGDFDLDKDIIVIPTEDISALLGLTLKKDEIYKLRVELDSQYRFLKIYKSGATYYQSLPVAFPSTTLTLLAYTQINYDVVTPTSNNQIANKKYVDDNKSSKTLLGNAQAEWLTNTADDKIGLQLTIDLSEEIANYDMLILVGMNSSCMILVTQVLTNMLSVMSLPYQDDGSTAVCRVRGSYDSEESEYNIKIGYPSSITPTLTTLPTFYLFGIKL